MNQNELMKSCRFAWMRSVKDGKLLPCKQMVFEQLLDAPSVKEICERIAALRKEDADYEKQKSKLKKMLPIITPHAVDFKSGKRKNEDAILGGLVMLDIDHIENPHELFEKQISNKVEELNIYFVAKTPSGHGLRIIAEREMGLSIEQMQAKLSEALDVDYDAVAKDAARASFLVPRSYVYYYAPLGLFSYPSEEARQYWQESASRALWADARSNCASRVPLPQSGVSESLEQCGTAEGVGTREAQMEPSETPEGLFYHGIPTARIAYHLQLALGGGDNPSVGERNTLYFSMAISMRYITDFRPDWLLRALPDFGLSEDERKQAIKSALSRPRKNKMDAVLLSAIHLAEQEAESTASQEKLSEAGLTSAASEMPMPYVPRLLRLINRRMPEAYRPAMIIASLPILGALATRIRFTYLDGQEQSLSFMACITAPAASGKSFIRKPIDLLLTPINEQDEIERQREMQYQEKLRAAKNSKMQPEDPHACPRNDGVNISIAKLLQKLTYAEGKHLIGICEEIDSLIKTEKAGTWSQKSDIYRLGFDNAEYAQSYMSQNSFSAKVRVYYNLLFTGTPRAMNRFFSSDNVENGLMTRTCFAQLPDTSYAQMPIFEDYSDAEKAEIIEWARRLDREEGVIACPIVSAAIMRWQENKRLQALDADSHSADILRRRAAVIGFRAGMLCYLMEGRQSKKQIGEFAEWVAEYTFRTQMAIFGEKLEEEISQGLEMATAKGAVESLLDLLPEVFDKSDLIALRVKRKQSTSPNAIRIVLYRWKKAGKIEQVEGLAKYRQLKKN